MRDILLTSFIGFALIQALRHTWIAALLWTWLSLMNPHRLTYGFAYDLPFAFMTAAAGFLSLLWNFDKVRLPKDAVVVMLVVFVGWMCVTTVFAIIPDISADFLSRAVKVQVMTLLCLAALRERRHIELFIWVNVLSLGFYGLKGGVFAVLSGGSARVWGPQDTFITDNNSLGLALVMTIPLMYYLRQVSLNRWVRLGLLVLMLLCAVATLSTQSRGAFLAILAMAFVLWTRSKNKLLPAIAIVIAGIALFSFMPESWEKRMQSIGNYQQDTSAQQRINAWTNAVNVANDRVTGAGFYIAHHKIFSKYAPNPSWIHTAHSIYMQVLGEHGWVGLGIFLSLGALGFWNAAQLRKRTLDRPETAWLHDLSGMIQVSMVGYAVGGAFLSLAYFDLPYNILVVLICSKYWLLEERWKTEKVGAFGATSSLEQRARRGGGSGGGTPSPVGA